MSDHWWRLPSNNSPTFWNDQVFHAEANKPKAHGFWNIHWNSQRSSWGNKWEYAGFTLVNTETGIHYQSGDYFNGLDASHSPKALSASANSTGFPKTVWLAFWETLQTERRAAERAHRKATALKRQNLLKHLAKINGTTPELIRAEEKNQREQKKQEQHALKSGKKVDNLLLFTGKINELQSDLARILVVMNEDPMLFKTPGSMRGFLYKVAALRWTLRNTLKSNTETHAEKK